MIQITMANSQVVEWTPEQYTDYIYDGKCFIIIKGKEWVGFYNMNSVISICVDK